MDAYQAYCSMMLAYSMGFHPAFTNQHSLSLTSRNTMPELIGEAKTNEENQNSRQAQHKDNVHQSRRQPLNKQLSRLTQKSKDKQRCPDLMTKYEEDQNQTKTLKKVQKPRLKDNRNTNSNLLRTFFRHIENLLQNENEVIHKIISKHKLKISLKKFEEWYEINKADRSTYIRLPLIRRIFFSIKSQDQTKIMRVVLYDFLKNDAYTCYLTSTRTKRAAMKINLLSIRNLFCDIKDA